MKFNIEIKNRWSPRVQFSCEVETVHNAGNGLKLGLAVKAAYQRGANLRGANLRGADLGGADLGDVPFVENIDAKMLAAIEANKKAGTNGLKMSSWHGKEKGIDETNWCQTTHCRAGYAICLAGKAGFELERQIGPAAAGAMIYLKSTPDAPIPNFYCNDEEAMADIRERAAKQTGTI